MGIQHQVLYFTGLLDLTIDQRSMSSDSSLWFDELFTTGLRLDLGTGLSGRSYWIPHRKWEVWTAFTLGSWYGSRGFDGTGLEGRDERVGFLSPFDHAPVDAGVSIETWGGEPQPLCWSCLESWTLSLGVRSDDSCLRSLGVGQLHRAEIPFHVYTHL